MPVPLLRDWQMPHLALLFTLVVLLLVPESAIAQGAASATGEAWYKVATGILAIPAALVALVVSWNMMKKTRLETQKLEIEIIEKQNATLRQGTPAEKMESLALPLGDNQRALLLLVRYVLLELTLGLWNIVPSAFSYITRPIMWGAFWFFSSTGMHEYLQTPVIIVSVGSELFQLLFSIVYWSVFIGIGWPLFKDTCTYLNIPIKGLFDVPRLGWRRPSSG
jgi:hypothetical protein